MVSFNRKEIKFIQDQEVSRLATVSEKKWPQVTPILHVFDGKNFYFATDFDTKKIKNIEKNNKIAIVFDVYSRQPKGVTVQGFAEIIEKGKEFDYARKLLEDRHEYYRVNPIEEGEIPLVKIIPERKFGWDE